MTAAPQGMIKIVVLLNDAANCYNYKASMADNETLFWIICGITTGNPQHFDKSLSREKYTSKGIYTTRLYTSTLSDFFFQPTGCTKRFGIHWQEYFLFYSLSFSFHMVSFTPPFPCNETAWFSHKKECHVP